MNKSIWCPLPWSHLSVGNTGDLRLCSHSKKVENTLVMNGKRLTINDLSEDVLNNDTLKKVRLQMLSGEWPDMCRRCKIESENGHRSRHIREANYHKDFFTLDDAIAKTKEDGSIDSEIYTMDLRLGNHCNLKCAMCYPGESNKWYDDYVNLNEDFIRLNGIKYNFEKKSEKWILKNDTFKWIYDDTIFDDIKKISSSVKKIYIAGGEPLLTKKHYELLEYLIEIDKANDIYIEYNSNITKIPDRALSLWKHFKYVEIGASVDGQGIVNDYIRYPSEWDIINQNLKLIDDLDDNIIAHLTTTISVFNIEHLIDWLKWVNMQEFKKIGKLSSCICTTHPVYDPAFLNINIFEDKQKEELFGYLYNSIDNNSSDYMKKFLNNQVSFYNNFSRAMAVSDDILKKDRNKLKNFIIYMEKTRNQNWSKAFPLLLKFVNEWER